MSKKTGTYLIEFSDGQRIVCGNNYKSWLTHAAEYAWRRYQDKRPHLNLLTSVMFSHTPFVDNGGLKFATPMAYQEVIDEVSIGDGKTRAAFVDIKFEKSNIDRKRLDRELAYMGLI